jgi:hypothetical protein
MIEFKPAWWQLKKPLIDNGEALAVACICLVVLFICGFLLGTDAIMQNKYPNVKIPERPGCWPIFYLASSIIVLEIILAFFNVIGKK